MDELDRQWIIERYNQRFRKHGVDIATLASGTEQRRSLRFEILLDVGIAPGGSVLDLGCGFGDFFGFLRQRGVDVAYTGYDINPTLVAAARERYPDARFDVVDIQAESFPQFDFIVSSSAFNNRLQQTNNYEFVEDVLRICHAHARLGVAVDFLTSYVDFESPDAFYYQPERLLAIAKKITRRVALRHDYPLFEFCVYLYPDFAGWRA